MRSIAVLSFLIVFCVAEFAAAAPECDVFRTPAERQPQLNNCEEIVRLNWVPRDVLDYALKKWNANLASRGGLQDPNCAISGMKRNPLPDVCRSCPPYVPGQDYTACVKPYNGTFITCAADRCVSCRDENWVRRGFENECSIVINNLSGRWSGPGARTGRTPGYYVDFCAPTQNQLVTLFYFNGGVQSDMYKDDTRKNGTLAGMFMLEPRRSDDFIIKERNIPRYTPILQQFNNVVPTMRMIGLEESNNDSEEDRPMHATLIGTSNGCQSIGPESVEIMNRIAQRGRSTMFLAYHPNYKAPYASCENLPGARNQRQQQQQRRPPTSPPRRIN